MRSKDLVALMECRRKYKLQTLSLKGQNEKNLYFYKALKLLAEGIAKREKKQELMQKLTDYLEIKYQKEWFYLVWQKEKAVQKDSFYLKCFLESYQISPDQKIVADFPVTISLSGICNETVVDTVTGNADLLFLDGAQMVTGVILCRHFVKPYSYFGKKEHQVMNSVEMLVLMEGLVQKFPDRKVRVQMIQIIGAPNDRKKNIIEFSYEEFLKVYPQGILTHLQELMQKEETAECEKCLYKEMCVAPNIMRRKKIEDARIEKKKIELSENQKAVVNFGEGPLCVCASPGSGKTAVLVERVRHLIERGVKPHRILAITFTRKAAQEMTDRITMRNRPVISTMHSLAFRILREQEYLIGTVRLATTVDCKYLLLNILNDAPLIRGANYDALTVRWGLVDTLLKDFTFIDKYGEDGFRETFPKKDVENIIFIKQMYDKAFRENGYITYDGQIAMAVNILKKNPGILKTVRDSFDYIMVDEAQDLDEVQAEFVMLLADPKKNNLAIFGDADQAIYGFRGGSNQFLLKFSDYYPEAEILQLKHNYRSSQEIIELANELIAQNRMRVPITVEADYATGYRPVYIPGFYMPRIVELIDEIKQKGYDYKDIAIIARTNKELEELCAAISRRATESGKLIPFNKPKYYLRQDFVFQTLFDLLELKVKGMYQDKPLFRLLTSMGCEITKENPQNSIYEEHIMRKMIYDFEGMEANRYYLEEKSPLICAYARIYRALQKLQLPIKEALEGLQVELFSESICTEETFRKLKELIDEKKILSYKQLYDTMLALTLFEDDTRVYYEEADQNRIHMLTAHDAKGKEFSVVILWAIDEFEGRETEEERRTLYVALTRAKRVLFLLEGYQGKSDYLRELSNFIVVNRRKRFEK